MSLRIDCHAYRCRLSRRRPIFKMPSARALHLSSSLNTNIWVSSWWVHAYDGCCCVDLSGDLTCDDCTQVLMSVVIFVLLSSQDGFSRDWIVDEQGHRTAPALYNGIFSTIAFLLGAVTSIASGFFGMKIAVYANARTALEARKGIAPAFMCGRFSCT